MTSTVYYTPTMSDDSTLLENTEVGSSITDSLIRLLWRCGTFFSGIVVLAAGVLYVKVSVKCTICLLILYVPLFTYYCCISCGQCYAFEILHYAFDILLLHIMFSSTYDYHMHTIIFIAARIFVILS